MPSPRTPQLSLKVLELSNSTDDDRQLLSDLKQPIIAPSPEHEVFSPDALVETAPTTMLLNSLPLDVGDQTKLNQKASRAKLASSRRLSVSRQNQSQDNVLLMESASENTNDSQEYLEDDWGQDSDLDLSDDETDSEYEEFGRADRDDRDEEIDSISVSRRFKGEKRRKSRTGKTAVKTELDEPNEGNNHSHNLDLLQVYRQNPTLKLRNRIVTQNLGLVRKEAYHWVNQCAETFDDLVQVGSIGLIRAIERFDMNRGHAFSSFAIPYIRGEIQHYLRDKSPTVRMPRNWLTLYNQGCKQIRLLRMEIQREPLDQEVADRLKISVSEWQEIKLACQNRSPVSLDTPLSDENDNPTFLGDIVTDQKYHSFQLAQEDSLRIQQALDLLEDRTRQIVEFVFLKEFTHREVAETLGISAVTVSRQLKKGLEVLRNVLTTPLE